MLYRLWESKNLRELGRKARLHITQYTHRSSSDNHDHIILLGCIMSNRLHYSWISRAKKMDFAYWPSVNPLFTVVSWKQLERNSYNISFRSTIPGLNIYTGFYVTLLVEFCSCIFHPLSILTSASFLLGICMYIDGMLKDLKNQIDRVEDSKCFQSSSFVQKIVEGIRYHEEIIEYLDQIQHF